MRIVNIDKDNIYLIQDMYNEAFPKQEQTPWKELIKYIDLHLCVGNMYYDKNQLVGFSIHTENDKALYLMFFATNSSIRSKGYGSKIIKEFKNNYKDKNIYFSVEKLDEKAKNLIQRVKRINFYNKNGFILLPDSVKYRGVIYSFMGLGNDLKINEVNNLFKQKMKIFKKNK